MKFKAKKILALLTVISLNLLKNILGQSPGIQLILGNEWDPEYPEHKLAQHHKTCQIFRPEKRGGTQKEKGEWGEEALKKKKKTQVNSGVLHKHKTKFLWKNNDFFGGLPDQ